MVPVHTGEAGKGLLRFLIHDNDHIPAQVRRNTR